MPLIYCIYVYYCFLILMYDYVKCLNLALFKAQLRLLSVLSVYVIIFNT